MNINIHRTCRNLTDISVIYIFICRIYKIKNPEIINLVINSIRSVITYKHKNKCKLSNIFLKKDVFE